MAAKAPSAELQNFLQQEQVTVVCARSLQICNLPVSGSLCTLCRLMLAIDHLLVAWTNLFPDSTLRPSSLVALGHAGARAASKHSGEVDGAVLGLVHFWQPGQLPQQQGAELPGQL